MNNMLVLTGINTVDNYASMIISYLNSSITLISEMALAGTYFKEIEK